MRITYFQNNYDIKTSLYEDVTWEELIEVFSEHTVQTNKDGMMFSLITFKQATDLEDDTPLSGNESPRTDKRCTENVGCYHGLVFDYDGKGADIATIIQRYAEFRHLGYTSYRHAINDKGEQKFRVIIPFLTPCPFEEWDRRKECFLEFAGPEIDCSCVSHSRSFYLPACPENGLPYKDFWHLDGIVLDWELFTPKPVPVYTQTVTKPIPLSDLQQALDKLQQHAPILPNEDRYWLVRAVAKFVGAPQAITECRSRWPDATYNGKYEDMVKKLSSKGPGMKRILDEIHKYDPGYCSLPKEDFIMQKIQEKLAKKYGE